jgi:hypothetical protein
MKVLKLSLNPLAFAARVVARIVVHINPLYGALRNVTMTFWTIAWEEKAVFLIMTTRAHINGFLAHFAA